MTKIDLDTLAKKHATSGLLPSEIDTLFAEVENLREKIAASLVVLPGRKNPTSDLQRLVNLARGMLDG